jgi:His-Xaa-Ser system radical SAM maturase HxsC
MCPQPPGKDAEYYFEQSILMISLMKDKKGGHLGITGGEPTILGPELVKIIGLCRKLLPGTILTLLTNGKKLRDFEFTKDLASVGWPNLRFEIPLYADNDTEHDEILESPGSFYETMEGLHNLALLNQPVGLRTVLHSLTIERLVQFSEFVYRNLPFVFQVAFMGMETTGKAKDNLNILWIDPFEYQDKLSSAVYHLHRRKIPVSIYNHQLCLLPNDLWRFARRSISYWKETYLPICIGCSLKNVCCGIFNTGTKNSAYIRPISEKAIPKEWRDPNNYCREK